MFLFLFLITRNCSEIRALVSFLCFLMVGVSRPSLCALLQSVLSCFFSSSLLYSFLQAGRFTTKRQRESPINLVANHALDSSVDLCLCPSVCICSFLFPPSLTPIFSLFNQPFSFVHVLRNSGSSLPPARQASSLDIPFSSHPPSPSPHPPSSTSQSVFFARGFPSHTHIVGIQNSYKHVMSNESSHQSRRPEQPRRFLFLLQPFKI